jgi:hypothetical protein
MAEADSAVNPDFLGIGAAEGHASGHLSQPMAVDWSFIEMYDANDSAHSGFPMGFHLQQLIVGCYLKLRTVVGKISPSGRAHLRR